MVRLLTCLIFTHEGRLNQNIWLFNQVTAEDIHQVEWTEEDDVHNVQMLARMVQLLKSNCSMFDPSKTV